MEETGRLGELPEIYAAASRLREAGLDNAALAARLEMPPEAVGPLLRIAAAKLAAVMNEPRSGGDAG